MEGFLLYFRAISVTGSIFLFLLCFLLTVQGQYIIDFPTHENIKKAALSCLYTAILYVFTGIGSWLLLNRIHNTKTLKSNGGEYGKTNSNNYENNDFRNIDEAQTLLGRQENDD